MATVYITVSTEWRQIEPDGSTCHVCGDNCYLNMHGLFVHVCDQLSANPSFVFCGSCVDAAMEAVDGQD